MRNVEAGGKLARIEHPGKIRKPQAAATHGTGNTETGSVDFRVRAFGEKTLDDLLQAVVFVRGKALVANMNQLAALKTIQCEVNLGAAYVAGENHLAISSVPVPSAPGAGK